ncbi:MAG: hypothetical protein ACRYG5_03570 [Janthinobacterium lividum]
MTEADKKGPTPAYGSYRSLVTFFNSRRDDGHITDVVDRSLMRNFSGSTANELLATLRFFKMINEKGVPAQRYKAVVTADDGARKELMQQILRDSYPFIFAAPGFDVERATADQVATQFRAQGISGSTLSRAVAFFLAAAEDAGVKVSPHIKPPPMPRSGNPKPKKETPARPNVGEDLGAGERKESVPIGSEILDIPIPINRKVRITLPTDFKASDWSLFKTILDAYIEGWKAEKDAISTIEKDKGPTPKE